MSRTIARRVVAGALAFGSVAIMTCDAIAQTTSASSSDLIAFDRPEAWAMKYFTSATTLNGLETPDRPSAGSLAVQLEGGWLPTLTDAQQRVGFNGTSPQDLNKAPVFLRPRITLGVSRSLAIIAAVDPPIRSFGVTPRLLAVGVDGVIRDSGEWRLGLRAHGQIGNVTAAVTCPAASVSFAPGSPNNPTGCTAESSDVTSLRYVGLEFEVARRVGRRLLPHAAAGANAIDAIFQTNAETYGRPDRTRMRSRGVAFAATAGIAYAFTERFAVTADAFYTPLTVRRTAGSATTIDPLFNARTLISYRVLR